MTSEKAGKTEGSLGTPPWFTDDGLRWGRDVAAPNGSGGVEGEVSVGSGPSGAGGTRTPRTVRSSEDQERLLCRTSSSLRVRSLILSAKVWNPSTSDTSGPVKVRGDPRVRVEILPHRSTSSLPPSRVHSHVPGSCPPHTTHSVSDVRVVLTPPLSPSLPGTSVGRARLSRKER